MAEADNPADAPADKPAKGRAKKAATPPTKPAKKAVMAPAKQAVKAPAKKAPKAPATPLTKTARAPVAKAAKPPVAKIAKAPVTKPPKAPVMKAAKPPVTKAAKPPAKKAAKAPATQPAKPRGSARVKVVEEVGRSYFEALGARDADAAAAHFHQDGIDDIVALGMFRGPDAVRRLFREMFAAMPDATMRIERIVADNEVAAVQWRLAGTFDGGPFQGIEPTGRRVELRGFDALEVDGDGKITRNTGYYDGAAFARAIGLLPPQDSGVDKAMLAGFNAVTKLRNAVGSR